MTLLDRGSFQSNASLRFFETEESLNGELSRKAKIFYVIEKLSGLLHLPHRKEKQAKQLYGHVNDQQFDPVHLAAALTYVAANSEPVHPRWKKLVAQKCLKLSKLESRVLGNYNRVYWRKKLNNAVGRLKDQNDIKPETVQGVEYMHFILKKLELNDCIENFCIRKISILFMDPSHQSRSRVAAAGALILIGQERFEENTSKHIGPGELADLLCVDKQTLKEYRQELKEVI